MNIIKFHSSKLKSINEMDGDCCDHVENDYTKSIGYFRESDGFGTVGKLYVCEDCKKEAEDEEANKVDICDDCKEEFKNKDLTEWRWYDFYAAQGDVPLKICKTCWGATKHQDRMHKDADDEACELGTDDLFNY